MYDHVETELRGLKWLLIALACYFTWGFVVGTAVSNPYWWYYESTEFYLRSLYSWYCLLYWLCPLLSIWCCNDLSALVHFQRGTYYDEFETLLTNKRQKDKPTGPETILLWNVVGFAMKPSAEPEPLSMPLFVLFCPYAGSVGIHLEISCLSFHQIIRTTVHAPWFAQQKPLCVVQGVKTCH